MLRRLVLMIGMVGAVAAAASGCGRSAPGIGATAVHGSRTHVRTFTGTVEAGPSNVQMRTAVAAPTAIEIRQAAARTAAEPGFSAKVTGTITASVFGGNALAFVGAGHFDPRSSSGALNLAVTLPGLLGIGGALPTTVVLDGESAYVKVPEELADVLPASERWLEADLASLGFGSDLSPAEILREVVRDTTGRVPGQRARVTLDPTRRLLQSLTVSYASSGSATSTVGGYHVIVRLRFTGFALQGASPAPPAAAVGSLTSALNALGF